MASECNLLKRKEKEFALKCIVKYETAIGHYYHSSHEMKKQVEELAVEESI